MFSFFKRKSEKEKLEEKFKSLMAEWHALSTTNRAASDAKYAEAQEIAQELDKLRNEVA